MIPQAIWALISLSSTWHLASRFDVSLPLTGGLYVLWYMISASLPASSNACSGLTTTGSQIGPSGMLVPLCNFAEVFLKSLWCGPEANFMEAMSHWMKAHVPHKWVGIRSYRVASQLSHVRTSFPLVTCAGLYKLTTDYVLVIKRSNNRTVSPRRCHSRGLRYLRMRIASVVLTRSSRILSD